MKKISRIAVLGLVAASSFNSSAQSFNMSGGMNISAFNFYTEGERLYHNDIEEYSFGT